MYNDILAYLTTNITEDGVNENFMVIRGLVASWLDRNNTSKKHEVITDIWVDSYVDNLIVRPICREFVKESYSMNYAITDGQTIFIYVLLGYIVESKLGNTENTTTDTARNEDTNKEDTDNYTGSSKGLDPEAQVFKYVDVIAEYAVRNIIDLIKEEHIREYKNNPALRDKNHEAMDKVELPRLWKATIEGGQYRCNRCNFRKINLKIRYYSQ